MTRTAHVPARAFLSDVLGAVARLEPQSWTLTSGSRSFAWRSLNASFLGRRCQSRPAPLPAVWYGPTSSVGALAASSGCSPGSAAAASCASPELRLSGAPLARTVPDHFSLVWPVQAVARAQDISRARVQDISRARAQDVSRARAQDVSRARVGVYGSVRISQNSLPPREGNPAGSGFYAVPLKRRQPTARLRCTDDHLWGWPLIMGTGRCRAR